MERLLAKPKRINSLWSFGLTKSFIQMHLFLTFSAALGNMSKLYCTRLHENWLRLGIIQVTLASALALHKRSFVLHPQ